MSVTRRLAQVRLAQAEVRAARAELGEPAQALLQRVRDYPIASVSVAAGAGVALGHLDVHPLRVPGVAPLLGSGLLPLVTQGVRLLVENGLDGLADLDGGDPESPDNP
ncbi:MAG: hypothetical protein B7X33_05905 [Lysobacterales bacterium 13-68-4]|jgi:hypothetical protein|nr:MAG: hypothetical protein B7X45_08475 [Xanthomonadales bacterium 15-68-25]OZB61829.1 MAG: hypothetical protein B7X33_05905 [Xanthomonadales bacterium 13-68-4]OZB66528.1 MAG: hypothetical protein B7X39_10465 [Xanthomonadales bacterium 14-68-21]